MPKTLDELVQDALGAQLLALLRLTAENEALKEQLTAATTPPAPVAST